MIDLENFPTSETAKEMMGSVTKGWYDKAYVGKWLYQVMGLSLDKVKEIYQELPNQFFVETATWGLAYHEQKYGIPVKDNVSDEDRRRVILQRMKSRVPMTPYQLERLLKRQFGIEAEVSDIHDPGSLGYQPTHPNVFHVIVWGRDQNMVLDYAMIEQQIRQVNQSHTIFSVEHRQVFNQTVEVFAGTLITELVEYDIKARPLNRDTEARAKFGVTMVIDINITENIETGGSKDGNRQR